MPTPDRPKDPMRRRALQTAAGAAAMTLIPPQAAPAATPVPAAGNAAAYTFRVGTFRALAVGDGQATWPAFPTYASNVEEPALRQSLTRNFMDPVNYTLNFTTLYVDTGRNRVLIDTGAGADLGPGLGRLAANLAAAGVAPTAVDAIVLTHAHPDHIGGIVAADGGLTFPNAQVFVAEAEWRHWTAPTIDFGAMTIPDGFRALFQASTARHLGAVAGRVTLFQPGAEILPGVSTIDCAGHSAGHVAVRLSSGGSTLIHVGDVFHSQAFDLDNPGWATAFDLDPAAAAAARGRLLDQAEVDGTLLMATHMPFPGLGRIRRIGGVHRWIPAPWMFGPDTDPTLPL